MQDEHGTWRQVAWRDWFPWLCLLRTFRLAIDFRKLLLAAVALAITALGWWTFALVLRVDDTVRPGAVFATPVAPATLSAPHSVPALGETIRAWPWANPLVVAWAQLTGPIWGLFNHALRWSEFTYLLLCGLWAVAVWAVAGATISRIAAVELTLEERISLRVALRFARARWVSYFWAPLFPLVGVLFIVLCMSLFGWLLRFDLGLLLMGLIWPLYLLAGLLVVVVLAGLLFGWPLMWSTISVEGTDMFDALSRTYSYVYQRPLHYVFYVCVAALYGLLGWLLVSGAAAAIVYLSFWGASWTAGAERTNDLLASLPSGLFDLSSATDERIANEGDFGALGRTGVRVISFWVGCVGLLALGFVYSYFWTASTAIYLLLRRQTDATEMDEIFTDDEGEPHALPPLKTDAAGVPLVDPGETTAEEASSAAEITPDEDEPQSSGSEN